MPWEPLVRAARLQVKVPRAGRRAAARASLMLRAVPWCGRLHRSRTAVSVVANAAGRFSTDRYVRPVREAGSEPLASASEVRAAYRREVPVGAPRPARARVRGQWSGESPIARSSAPIGSTRLAWARSGQVAPRQAGPAQAVRSATLARSPPVCGRWRALRRARSRSWAMASVYQSALE
jgi:hypothetical protein